VAAIGVGWGYHAPGALFSAGAVTVVDTSTALGELFSGPLNDTKAGPVTPRLAAS
jgi:phosphoglycolate phosphatase